MRTSLNDIKTIEAYLTDRLTISERLLFEARMLVNRELRKNVAWQREVCALVRRHHRTKIKAEFQRVHKRLFADAKNADVADEIRSIFNP